MLSFWFSLNFYLWCPKFSDLQPILFQVKVDEEASVSGSLVSGSGTSHAVSQAGASMSFSEAQRLISLYFSLCTKVDLSANLEWHVLIYFTFIYADIFIFWYAICRNLVSFSLCLMSMHELVKVWSRFIIKLWFDDYLLHMLSMHVFFHFFMIYWFHDRLSIVTFQYYWGLWGHHIHNCSLLYLTHPWEVKTC